MTMGRTLRLALAGCGLLVGLPAAAFAGDEEVSLKERIKQLEDQVLELRQAQSNTQGRDSELLSSQIDRYLQDQEKGSLWKDRHGGDLGKTVKSLWMTGSLRTRPEYWDNFADFSDATDDSGVQTFTRARLGIGAQLQRGAAVYLELNMPGSWGNSTTTYANDGGSAVTPMLYQAYVTGLLADKLGWDTKIGRSEMVRGNEFVLGDRDFTQGGLYFDGITLSKDYTDSKTKVDVFYAKLVEGFKGPKVDANAYLFGVYANMYDSGLEPYYLLVKNNNDVAGPGVTVRDVHTAGVRYHGNRYRDDEGGFGWDVDAAGQFSGDISYAADARVHYKMGHRGWAPKIWAQAAYAHGDKDAADTSYNPLFQDAHGRYGYSDIWFFSNLMIGGLGFEVSPTAGYTWGVSARSYHLARVPAGSGAGKSERLAMEYDLYMKHEWSANVAIEAAYAFVHWRSSNTTGLDDVQRAYVNVIVSF
jgi:hypothetical protein